MPRYTNRFTSPKYLEETIENDDLGIVGTIRIKPSGVLWKPKGQQKYYRVDLDSFTSWITGTASGATRVKN